MSAKPYSTGDYVCWVWGDRWAYGTVAESYHRKDNQPNGDGRAVHDDGDGLAYLIEQSDGGRILKAHSELQKA